MTQKNPVNARSRFWKEVKREIIENEARANAKGKDNRHLIKTDRLPSSSTSLQLAPTTTVQSVKGNE